MPTLTDLKALDETAADRRALLQDLQCNILSSHDRPNTHYFFLHFSNSQQARQVLRGLASGKHWATAGLALEPELGARARRRTKAEKVEAARHEPVAGFSTSLMLTAACYRQLELELPSDPAFQQGLAGRDGKLEGAARLNDPERVRRESGVHALFAVGYDLPVTAWRQVKEEILHWLQELRVEVRQEEGYVLRHSSRGRVNAIEPFGYRDAISQPLFFERDLGERGKREGAAATVAGGKWSSFAPLSLVLVPDPHGKSKESHGTYVAYRKLRQKVDLFYDQAKRLADAAPELPNGQRLTANEVADRLIGRRVDGTPLDGGPNLNDFVYPNDSVCPMHAHVRKVNPRDTWARPHRIVRRSTVYGPKLGRDAEGRPILPVQRDSTQDANQPDVGLLFFSCQADINNQFEFLQAQWANDVRSGADTVIGQLPPGGQNRISLNGSGPSLPYEPVVEVLAGDYFFAPSISFFSSLESSSRGV